MAQIQFLHLCIDDRTLLIPISILPVQIWWCEVSEIDCAVERAIERI